MSDKSCGDIPSSSSSEEESLLSSSFGILRSFLLSPPSELAEGLILASS